ncbi:MAG: hypothetical protein MHM6MM_004392 [Cercozoa sp. M6MM]
MPYYEIDGTHLAFETGGSFDVPEKFFCPSAKERIAAKSESERHVSMRTYALLYRMLQRLNVTTERLYFEGDRPRLNTWHVSLAHESTGDTVVSVVALSKDTKIGVDVVLYLRPRLDALVSSATSIFTVAENRRLEEYGLRVDRLRFLAWRFAMREALLKSEGRGLTSLSDFKQLLQHVPVETTRIDGGHILASRAIEHENIGIILSLCMCTACNDSNES